MKTAQEFIDFFEAIPEDRWCVNLLNDGDGRSCALGHLGVRHCFDFNWTASIFEDLFNYYLQEKSANINNFNTDFGDHPKERILVALEHIRGAGG